MKIITTTYEEGGARTAVTEAALLPEAGQQETRVLNIHPGIVFQRVLGFGGAVTDAAGSVYARLGEAERREFIGACYGPEGLAYTLGRTHIDSCDFSEGMYAADDDPADEALARFDMARPGKYVFPLLDDISAVQPALRLMLAPWSPPAYMKDNASRVGGGRLLPEYRRRWARYIARYASELAARGCHPFALTSQNEPDAVQTWDSCLYSPEEERIFLRDHLAPELERAGLGELVLAVWDHNKERLYERVDAICSDPAADRLVGAAAYHWYSGDHFGALRLVRAKYPDKLLIFTEGCIEYSLFDGAAQLANARRYAREILHGLNAGMNAFLDWNILLDSEGGPNHVGNFCEAPVMANADGTLRYNLSWHYIRHFSRHIRPGAAVLGSSCFDEAGHAFCAVRNPDGSTAAVLLNTGDGDGSCFLRINGRIAEIACPACSISTLLIGEGEA